MNNELFNPKFCKGTRKMTAAEITGVSKMAVPMYDEAKSTLFYHGTGDEAAAKNIMRIGIQPQQESKTADSLMSKLAVTSPTSTMYHVSRQSNRASILKKGLIPQVREFESIERKAGIYFMQTLEQALHWAETMADYEVLKPVDVWRVVMPDDIDLQQDLTPDMDDIYDAWVTYDKIPPDYLQVIKTVAPGTSNTKRPSKVKQANTDEINLWHGGRISGQIELQNPTKGRYEAGPGLYLTTSYERAYSYAKGGGSTFLVTLKPNLKWADETPIPLADGIEFAKRNLGNKAKDIIADLQRNCSRMKKDSFTADIIINLVVNYEAGAGKKGLALAKFLVEHGVDAALENKSGDEQWVVVFNPRAIVRTKKVPASEVTLEMRHLPKVASTPFKDWLGKTKTLPQSNAQDLSVTNFLNNEGVQPEPFMGGKYTIRKGYGTYRKGYSEDSPEIKQGYYVVFDGYKPIASMCQGSLVVDKKYRGLGIGTQLAKAFMQDYPDYRPSSVTPKSKKVFEKAFNGKTGSTMILYHGTNEPFTRVDMNKGAQRVFWLTNDLESLKNGERGAASTKYILRCKVTINNPAGWAEYEKKSLGELKRDGYDGVILPDDEKSFDVIVFKSSQVKVLGQEKEKMAAITAIPFDVIIKQGEAKGVIVSDPASIKQEFIDSYGIKEDAANQILEDLGNTRVAILRKISIYPAYQSKGFGTKLLKRFEREAKSRGAKAIILLAFPDSYGEGDTVYGGLDPEELYNWYEKNGYERVDDIYQDDPVYVKSASVQANLPWIKVISANASETTDRPNIMYKTFMARWDLDNGDYENEITLKSGVELDRVEYSIDNSTWKSLSSNRIVSSFKNALLKKAQTIGPVYHGTTYDFDDFKRNKGLRSGFLGMTWKTDVFAYFFTKDKGQAVAYAKNRQLHTKQPARLITAYLTINNMLDLTNPNWVTHPINTPPLPLHKAEPGADPDDIYEEHADELNSSTGVLDYLVNYLLVDEMTSTEWGDLAIDDGRDNWNQKKREPQLEDGFKAYDLFDNKKVSDALRYLGFDGAKVPEGDDSEFGGESYCVFSSNQVKIQSNIQIDSGRKAAKTVNDTLPEWTGEGRIPYFVGQNMPGKLSNIKMVPIEQLEPTEFGESEQSLKGMEN